MIYFRSDYSQGAHPRVMEALARTNLEHTDGYGVDAHCERAAELVRELTKDPDASVYMMTGGTSCNVTVASCLRPYQSVISARSGHMYYHETGAVEATGHRVLALEGVEGKLSPELIDKAMSEFEDEHTPQPKMVYLSQSTEIGTVYSRSELAAIRDKCNEYGLFLYLDGARLGAALTSRGNDLPIDELAALCDAYYIGGTKNGALFGEALVIRNRELSDHFRWMMKRQCGLLAKGRLIGVQFEALLEGGEQSLYYEIAAKENRIADILRDGLGEMGITFFSPSTTNQIFPILKTEVVRELQKEFFFYEWAKESGGMIPIRLVTGWGTTESDAEAFLDAVKRIR